MTPIELPFALPGFEVDEVQEQNEVIEIVAHSNAMVAICPACQRRSRWVHSYYQRAPTDLPVADRRVHLTLTVRRFRCLNQHCAKVTFAERLPEFLAPHRQRTERLETSLGAVALAVGGQAGQTLARKLNMSASRDTLLRLIRRRSIVPLDDLTVLGVDDWAQRRGRVYGTILVDLERRRAVDLLPDRTAETLAQWLQAHASIQTIARDRSGEYARGISRGAPQAQQVADRWHLLLNLREAVEKLLDRLRPELTSYWPTKTPKKTGEIRMIRQRYRCQPELAARDGRRARLLALHEKIHRLYSAGHSISTIAQQLKLSRTTVYRYLSMSAVPERRTHSRRTSILDPFVDYLSQRWITGCRNASQLWREIKQQGYPGTRKQVTEWVYERNRKSKRTNGMEEAHPFSGMSRIHPHAAGVDIGAIEIVACVPGDENTQLVKAFGNYTVDLQSLAKCMKSHNIQTVAMESTGVYWIPLFEELERQGFECLLISSRSLRRVAGRKSDITDAQWIQTLHTYGLLEGSFRPQADLVALRTLLRHRSQLVEHRSPHIQHMQKALLQMNVQLSQAVTDVGTAITNLLSGTTALYHLQAPDNAAFPYIVWNIQGGGPVNLDSNRVDNLVIFVRTYVQGAGSAAVAGSIDAQVDAAFHMSPLTVTGYTNTWLAREQYLENVQNEPSGNVIHMAGGLYRCRLDVT